MRLPGLICLLAMIFIAQAAWCQSQGGGQRGPRTLLPRAEEIALARSAAPAAVSDSATIYVLGQLEYEEAVRGTNGNACYVSRDWLESLEPHCFDAEGAATVMAMAMHRVARLHQGQSIAEADREIADGLASGRFRLPRRPAMSYMMSAAQRLVSDDGRAVGRWQPHLMIYYPYLTSADVGLGGTSDTAGRRRGGQRQAAGQHHDRGEGLRAAQGRRRRIALNNDDDRPLVDAVLKHGDERAFSTLYDRHTPALYKLALRLTGGYEAEAAEIVHDAWVKAAQRLATFEWRSALRSWLGSCVINRWREVSRAAARSPVLPMDETIHPGEDARLTGTLDRLDLERAIGGLADGYRQVFVLHDVEGYTHEEIGTMLGIEAGTSKSQLSRARRELRKALERGEA